MTNPYRASCIHSWEPVADKFGYCAGWECKECHQILYGRKIIPLRWWERFCIGWHHYVSILHEWTPCGCVECQEAFKASLWQRKFCLWCKREADFQETPDVYDAANYWQFKEAKALSYPVRTPDGMDRHSRYAEFFRFDFIRTQDDPIITGEVQVFNEVDES